MRAYFSTALVTLYVLLFFSKFRVSGFWHREEIFGGVDASTRVQDLVLDKLEVELHQSCFVFRSEGHLGDLHRVCLNHSAVSCVLSNYRSRCESVPS